MNQRNVLKIKEAILVARLYVNCGFCADNKANRPQQRHRGLTGKQPMLPNCIKFTPLPLMRKRA